MTEHVLSGLTKRRAELAGEAEALRTRLAQIGADLTHLDAVIRLFDPDYDLAAIRPKRPRDADATRPGELSRFVLGVLREATEPMPTPEIAARFMAERGEDQTQRSRVRDITKRVGMALRHQEQRGVVRSRAGVGRVLLWSVVGWREHKVNLRFATRSPTVKTDVSKAGERHGSSVRGSYREST